MGYFIFLAVACNVSMDGTSYRYTKRGNKLDLSKYEISHAHTLCRIGNDGSANGPGDF